VNPLPPPPPPRPDLSAWQDDGSPPASGRSARPPLVTAAGVILLVLGAVQALAGIVLMALSPADLANLGSVGNLNLDRVGWGLGAFSLVIGLVEILAGFLVLRLSSGGRILALVLASLGLIGGIGSVSGGSPAGVLTLGAYGVVIYALFAHGVVFRGARRG
jgi:hypothetical protein